MIEQFGADALRLYVMFVAPPEKEVEWTDTGLEGSFRFLSRVWRLVDYLMPVVAGAAAPEGLALDDDERGLRRRTHVTIRRVTQDIDPRMHLNTAISALMEQVNELYGFCDRHGLRPTGHDNDHAPAIDRPETAAVLAEAVKSLVLMLSPFTPHLAEELWARLGHEDGVVAAGWPPFDDEAAREEAIEIPVQVNGKVRARVSLPAGASEDDMREAALEAVRGHIAGQEVVKVVVANRRLVSVVVRPRR
jgi:leucyl-tRNA synthetase